MLQNKLLTLKHVLPCATTLFVESRGCGSGAKRACHGWYYLKLRPNVGRRFMRQERQAILPLAVSAGNPWPSPRVRVRWGFNYLYPDPYPLHPYPHTPGVWQTLDLSCGPLLRTACPSSSGETRTLGRSFRFIHSKMGMIKLSTSRYYGFVFLF